MCDSVRRAWSRLAQGYSWAAVGLWLLALAGPACAAPCAGPPLAAQALAPGLWLVPAADGDADATNRGQVVNLVLARDGARLWALGAGPTPAFARRLRCTARQLAGQPLTDVLIPHARAELALGLRGLGPVRAWAHEQVAAAMRVQCPVCEQRLRQRLGAAAADLGRAPVRLPGRLLQGSAGRVGPFEWSVLPRAQGRVATVFRLADVGIAHGLLWGDGPPDGRDADMRTLASSLALLAALAEGPGGGVARWVGEQGPVQPADWAARQAAYLAALQATADAAVEQGLLGQPPPPLDGAGHPRHALNWQRAWRQAEDRLLGGAPR